MKQIMIISAAALVMAGCQSMSSLSFFQYDSLPVVNSTYKSGATKSSVIAAGGQPDSKINVGNNGNTCFNYTLRKNGSTSPFFVAFNKQDRVTNYGYETCQNAMSKGFASFKEPMKQVY